MNDATYQLPEPSLEIRTGAKGDAVVFGSPADLGPRADTDFDYPEHYRTRMLIDVPHDGAWIPDEFLVDGQGEPIHADTLRSHYVHERDWGASLVAERLAGRLELDGYVAVGVARVLLDFGRFPGITTRTADHLQRFAINYPFSELLSFRQKRRVLEAYYDRISRSLEDHLDGKLLKIAIHTYDRYNKSGTERPAVSLMTRAIGYQTESELPWGIFDPLYPDVLAEDTCDRILRDRISLTLEKTNVPVAHNYPYCLPEGSLEVRHQVWAFFRFVQRSFEQSHPGTAGHEDYLPVWEMLLDTNLRSSDSAALRSYIHMYRRAPAGQKRRFHRAEAAYEHIGAYVADRRQELLHEYRFSPERPSSIAIEVRKDIVYELDALGHPVRARRDLIGEVADAIALAVAQYLRSDRVHGGLPVEALERRAPWYLPPRTPPVL